MNKTRYFEWIAGESQGEVLVLDNIEMIEGEEYYHFTNGDTCAKEFISPMTNNITELKNKFMVEIESATDPWTFVKIEAKRYVDQSMQGEEYEIPTLHDMLRSGNGSSSSINDSDIGKKKLVPPKSLPLHIPELPNISEYEKKKVIVDNKTKNNDVSIGVIVPTVEPIVASFIPEQKNVEQNKKNHFDPVRILVESCKKHETEIDLTLTINLPAKSMYMIADSEFDNGGDKFIDFVVDDIDVSMIIASLKEQLKATYSDQILK